MTIQKLLATRDDAIAREDAPAYLAALDAIRLARIPAQIDHCIGNEFYGPKLRDAGINRGADIKTMEDFRRLPAFMTKADHRASQQASLEKYGHSFGLHTCVPKESIIHVAGTSGTTGMPTFYLFTRRDLDMTYEMVGRMLKKAGVRPGDTVLHLFGLSMWLGGTTFMQSLEAYGAHPIPLGAEAGVSRALQYLAACRPRVIAGTPSFLSYLIDRAPEELGKPASAFGVDIVFCGGEPGPAIPPVRKKLQEGYGAKVFDTMLGGWGNAALECGGEHHNGLHFLADEYCFRYDLVDPATREPIELKDGATGEGIHSGLYYEAGPGLRYATGDMLTLHVGTCPHCGEFGTRYSVQGRADDLLNVRGVKIFPSAIKEVVESLRPRTNGQLEIVLDAPPPRVVPPVAVTVEAGEGVAAGDFDSLASEIEDQIKARLRIPAKVSMVPEGTIPRSSHKTKLVRVRDAVTG
ncbi:phenylacetate--CoA ligase [Sulfitobacter porphyrae]|nr:phenylacetate--CoA ligase [Sulfitobacter porphyrae]